MKNFIKILILPVVIISMFGGFTNMALAVTTPLSVTFSANPLFKEVNFLPGDEVVRTVGVSNNSGASQDIIIEAINGINTGGLGDKLNLVIKEGDTMRYAATMGAFLNAGEVLLTPALLSGNSTLYSFGVTFVKDAGNDLQNKMLGFDLCVGFSGGTKHCSNTVVDNGGGDGGGGGTGGGGGATGGGGGATGGSQITNNTSGGNAEQPITLFIFNVNSGANSNGTALVTWDTNLFSTSQVIYGPKITSAYTLNLTAPNFGYPFYTAENSTPVINHSIPLTGLIPGQTYVYRVVSRISQPTISQEYEFTVPTFPQPGNPAIGGPLAIQTGDGAIPGPTADAFTEEPPLFDINANAAPNEAPLFDVISEPVQSTWWNSLFSKCSWISLLVLLAGYLLWRLILKPRYERRRLLEREIRRKFFAYYSLYSGLAIVVALILVIYCPIPVFLLALVLSGGTYVYLSIKKQ